MKVFQEQKELSSKDEYETENDKYVDVPDLIEIRLNEKEVKKETQEENGTELFYTSNCSKMVTEKNIEELKIKQEDNVTGFCKIKDEYDIKTENDEYVDTYEVEFNEVMIKEEMQEGNGTELVYNSDCYREMNIKDVKLKQEESNVTGFCENDASSQYLQEDTGAMGNVSKQLSKNNKSMVDIKNRTEGKPFKCEFCPKKFKTIINFEKHMRTHTGEKPYRFLFNMETNSDGSHKGHKKRKIDDMLDDEKREERRRRNREQAKRYRDKKGNTEERRKKNSERCKRYRDIKRIEMAGLSMRPKQNNKDYCKRYRDKKRISNLQTCDISNLNNVSLHEEKKDQKIDEEEQREEKKRKNREKAKRFRDNNKNNEEIKLKNSEKCKLYRDNKRIANLNDVPHRVHTSQIVDPSTINIPYVPPVVHASQIADPSTIDVPCVPPVIHPSEIAGPSTRDVPCVPPLHYSSQIEGASTTDVPYSPPIQYNNNSTEDRVQGSYLPNIHIQTYSDFIQNSSSHRQFEKDFFENEFGVACDICDRLWFKNELKYLPNDDTTRNIEFIRTLLSTIAIPEIKICATCFALIQKQRIPPLSVYNGFKYPPLPDCLKDIPLDLVTERLISARIPFMQIRRLRHVHGQCGIYGQVINVPIEVNTMVNLLPRQIDDDHAVTVHIKRKTIHESSYVDGLVNKRKIKVWLRYLKDTPLYKSYDVSVDECFLNDTNYDVKDEIIFDEDGDNDILEQIPTEESLIAQQQTLMWNDDMYLRITAAEGNVLKSLLFDEHAEELSFPQIYLGQFREFRHGVSVTPFMMATSELRRSDRRGVTPQHLLYMAMKIIRIRIKESLKIAFKHVGQGIAITKEQIKSDDYIHGCIETNLAFLRSIPNSAHYWAERKRDLFAMIRQYGKPTVFFTVGANEIGWPRLLKLLYTLKNNVEISAEEAADLHFIEKSTLVNEDAVTCAIYFNKLVNMLLKLLQSKRYSPFRKYRLLHYFKRIEFQHRGSPHAHILAWLANAPEDALGRDYDKAIELIDFLTSVSAAEASGDIQLQTHKHSFNCYKGIAYRQQQKCRFDAPFMPLKTTMILTPMPDTEDDFQQYRAKYNAIRNNLENYEYDDFQSFYDENDIASDEEYVNIIRAGINRPRAFPKREPCEKWHNPFNPFIFNVVRSNTDFQFVIEEHSCAAYVVEYVNKTNRGVSNLQRKIIEIMDEHPEFNLFDITKNISVNLLNHTEMTSQEAAWYLLREPVSSSSTMIVYIPTIRPVERKRIKKTMKELGEVEDGSTDIWKENWFDKYEKRPEDLADITLAQFVAKYHRNHRGDYVLREEPKVIRYRNYDMATDYNEYRREMVTLHLPFRHEEADILAESRYIQLYEENESLILERRKEFESNLDIQKTLEICRELCREDVPDEINLY